MPIAEGKGKAPCYPATVYSIWVDRPENTKYPFVGLWIFGPDKMMKMSFVGYDEDKEGTYHFGGECRS